MANTNATGIKMELLKKKSDGKHEDHSATKKQSDDHSKRRADP
jgi:hypothetical protein